MGQGRRRRWRNGEETLSTRSTCDGSREWRNSALLRGDCEGLNDSVDDFRIRVKDFGGISFEQYQQIVTSGKASRTWDYSISFQFDDQMLRFVFWYGSHHRDGWDTVQPDREPVLLVSIEEGDNYFRLLDETGEQHVSLREVGFVKDQFVRVRRVPGADKREFDLDIAPVDVAKAFYTEVITNKLGLA